MKKWGDLPIEMQVEEIRPYYESLQQKLVSRILKKVLDTIFSSVMLIALSPLFLIIATAIKLDSPGPVFFRQVRVTQYGRTFRIFKFRTMVFNAEKIGTQVTVENDSRITRVGKIIRKFKLDEIAQVIDVFRGTMTFVGVRPEVVKYVEFYTPEMRATFLLPAGVTNLTSIYYKDERNLLTNAEDADRVYVQEILPSKMKLNLESLMDFSFLADLKVICATLFMMFGKQYKKEE